MHEVVQAFRPARQGGPKGPHYVIQGDTMRTIQLVATLVIVLGAPAATFAQSSKAATYITDEEVKKVNTLPGVDRQIRVVDIGNENLAVGIVHRGPTGGGAAAGGRRGGATAA